ALRGARPPRADPRPALRVLAPAAGQPRGAAAGAGGSLRREAARALARDTRRPRHSGRARADPEGVHGRSGRPSPRDGPRARPPRGRPAAPDGPAPDLLRVEDGHSAPPPDPR